MERLSIFFLELIFDLSSECIGHDIKRYLNLNLNLNLTTVLCNVLFLGVRLSVSNLFFVYNKFIDFWIYWTGEWVSDPVISFCILIYIIFFWFNVQLCVVVCTVLIEICLKKWQKNAKNKFHNIDDTLISTINTILNFNETNWTTASIESKQTKNKQTK